MFQTILTTILNKLPDLLVNFLGVFLGFFLSSMLQNQQAKKVEKQAQQEREKRIHTLLDRSLREIRDNRDIIKEEIQKKISKAEKNNEKITDELYNWLLNLTESLKKNSFEYLVATGLNKDMPEKINRSLYTAYHMTERITHRIKADRAALKYTEKYYPTDPEEQRNMLRRFQNMKTLNAETLDTLNKVSKIIQNYIKTGQVPEEQDLTTPLDDIIQ